MFGITTDEVQAALASGYFSTRGYNPKRWRCEEQGCFEIERRPQIELLVDCFPGANSFGDLDYIIERHGYLIIVEWKEYHPDFWDRLVGQRLLFERCSAPGRGIIVFVVVGNARTMHVSEWTVFWRGRMWGWSLSGLEELKTAVRKFELAALRAPLLGRQFLIRA